MAGALPNVAFLVYLVEFVLLLVLTGEGAACAPVMTSGNGTTTSSQHNGDSKAAQAIVKSHILTHLIEGFVIQEGAEPFPVSSVTVRFICLHRLPDTQDCGRPEWVFY